jgi:glutathione S-transferase
MKLYFAAASPFVRKVSIVAHECGLAERITRVTTAVMPHAPNADFARANPLIKVPALERDDGRVLYDSLVICEYLDALGKGGLFPAPGDARWDALRRHALADGILDAALLARYENVVRPEALRWPEWYAGQLKKIDHALDVAESEVAALPAAFDIGQVTLACALGYLDFRYPDLPWRTGRPALAAWWLAAAKRPSVAATVPVG